MPTVSKAALSFVARYAFAWVIAATTTGFASAQPSTVNLGNFELAGGGLNGVMNNATGISGANPGYTLWTYGNSGSGGLLQINGPTPSTLTLATTNLANTPNTPPANFSNTLSYNWQVITARNSSAQIFLDDGSGGTVALTPANQTAANVRLNELLKFNASSFYDPATNAPISATVGTFAFHFEDFNASTGFQSIHLTYTPVPEPACLMAIPLAVGLAYRLRKRTMRRDAVAPITA